MKVRRRARVVALQVLYEIDSSHHDPGVVLMQRFAEARLPAEAESFARQLVAGILQRRERLDALIQRHAPEWPIDQIAIIDRNVLRMAIYEFVVAEITPARVAINEAIELAKQYGSESAPRFVNGVLGALASIATASGPDSKTSSVSHG